MSLEIEKVAALAHIKLKPEEIEKLGKDLNSILSYVEQLKEIPTDDVKEMSHVLDMTNVFRKDEVIVSDARDKVLKYAPSTEGKFFKVPKVVDR